MSCGLFHDCAQHGYYAHPVAQNVLTHLDHGWQVAGAVGLLCLVLGAGVMVWTWREMVI